LAPEYFQHGKVSDKTDVYAFGVVLLELITGRKPIEARRPSGEENLVLWVSYSINSCEVALFFHNIMMVEFIPFVVIQGIASSKNLL